LEIKSQVLFGRYYLAFSVFFFQPERLGSGKILSELRIHYKSLLTRVYNHAGCSAYCKDFTVALKVIDVIDRKYMYDSVNTGNTMLHKIEILL